MSTYSRYILYKSQPRFSYFLPSIIAFATPVVEPAGTLRGRRWPRLLFSSFDNSLSYVLRSFLVSEELHRKAASTLSH